MVRSGALLTLLASAAGFFSQADARTKSSSKILPGSYIVEFDDATVSYYRMAH